MAALSKSTSSYVADDIEVLEGLEHVRKRPSMYIGGVDTRGLHHLIWEIVDNSVDEYLAGHCDEISVQLHKDASSITVEDNGRGIPVDTHKKTGKSALEVILTTLYAGGKFSEKNYLRSGGLHGIGSSAVNALSETLIATVWRDGHEWRQRFKRGRATTKVEQVRPFRGHGTAIYFKPDDEIFRRVQFHADTIRQHLEDISYVHGGLKLTFFDEAKNEKVLLHHPDGIAAYLNKIIEDDKRKCVHEGTFGIDKEEDKIRVETVLRWTESTDEHIRSYVNGIRTRGGGTHESGFRAGIAKAVKNYMDVHDIKTKGLSITPDDIREGVVGIISVFHNDPMFQGQTKDRLNNPEMASMVDGMVRSALETWLNNNRSVADAVIGRIILAARAREASREAVKEVRRKGAGSRRSNLPGKLLDCRSSDPEECELFIVEGQSAGGTAASGRDSRTQAVLPLKGKILNTESLALGKILQNQEVKDLVETLGTGIGPHFDPHKLRYHRIILLMDADSDGYHISTLLLTFFFRHMRELIQQGRLFLAQPPLYKIEVGKERHYARDDVDKEEILAKIASNRTVDVQRFKGLGEMNADQLKETTLSPKTRTLLRVDIESAVEADATFAQLLGKDASERYRIIMDEAAEADDLDV
ncbi:DNA gyrase/topoisomerase IV subunit B [Planctomicrobium piriforme]|uniref:DNA topoisomerase (ATP-hydrolyzing) n=1 Tax=Planctomicrobium piriforme TaxID=1576369 RepID=A0A1I3HDK9_9PLAN|nr:DNA gyrase subunit B [Planctomicrobium piriforme]SFI33826.1 DNA gyrase subunit B/topoisomerase-4 subunit B [Planctomicrobium piriforme]